jgi:hypothetical protein
MTIFLAAAVFSCEKAMLLHIVIIAIARNSLEVNFFITFGFNG